MTSLEKIISPTKLENAFNILCKERKDYSAYADIWKLRYSSTLRERSSEFCIWFL